MVLKARHLFFVFFAISILILFWYVMNRNTIAEIDFEIGKDYLVFWRSSDIYIFNPETLNFTEYYSFKPDRKVTDLVAKDDMLFVLTRNIVNRKIKLSTIDIVNNKITTEPLPYAIHKFFIYNNSLVFPRSTINRNSDGIISSDVIIRTSEAEKTIQIEGFAQPMHTVFDDKLFFYTTIELEYGDISIIDKEFNYSRLFDKKIPLIEFTFPFSDEKHLYFIGKKGIYVFNKQLKKEKIIFIKDVPFELPGNAYSVCQYGKFSYIFEGNGEGNSFLYVLDRDRLEIVNADTVDKWILSAEIIGKKIYTMGYKTDENGSNHYNLTIYDIKGKYLTLNKSIQTPRNFGRMKVYRPEKTSKM